MVIRPFIRRIVLLILLVSFNLIGCMTHKYIIDLKLNYNKDMVFYVEQEGTYFFKLYLSDLQLKDKQLIYSGSSMPENLCPHPSRNILLFAYTSHDSLLDYLCIYDCTKNKYLYRKTLSLLQNWNEYHSIGWSPNGESFYYSTYGGVKVYDPLNKKVISSSITEVDGRILQWDQCSILYTSSSLLGLTALTISYKTLLEPGEDASSNIKMAVLGPQKDKVYFVTQRVSKDAVTDVLKSLTIKTGEIDTIFYIKDKSITRIKMVDKGKMLLASNYYSYTDILLLDLSTYRLKNVLKNIFTESWEYQEESDRILYWDRKELKIKSVQL